MSKEKPIGHPADLSHDASEHGALEMDEEEVVDLLQVVKPGKALEPQEGGTTEDADFSADLDAMLDLLSEAENKKAVEAGDAPPFPDPTPVDHAVDPDESLELPDMADVDSILRQLGEAAPARDSDAGAEHEDVAGQRETSVPTGSGDVEELDALPITKSVAPDKDILPGAVELDDDFLASLPGDTDAKTPSAGSVNGQRDESDLDALLDDDAPLVDLADIDAALAQMDSKEPAMEEPAAKPQRKAAAPPAVDELASRDEVDLNELDALVDDVLAAAPPSAPGSAEETTVQTGEGAGLRRDLEQMDRELREAIAAARKSMEKDIVAALGRASSAEAGADALKGQVAAQGESIEALKKDVSGQTEKFQEIDRKLAEQPQRKQPGESPPEQPQFAELEKASATHTARLDGAEQSLAEQATRLQNAEQTIGGTTAKLKALEQSLATHTASLKQVEKSRVAFAGRIDALEQGQSEIKESLANCGRRLEEGDSSAKELLESLPPLQTRLEGIEHSLLEQVARLKGVEAEVEGQKGAEAPQIAEHIKGVQEVVQNVSILNDRLSSLEARFEAMQADMEKAAATAAAKVIREEIAALMQSGQ